MSRDNCEKRNAMKFIGNQYLQMIYVTICTEVVQNFVTIASKYMYPDAFRYFLLSFDNFSHFNLTVQLINFYIICIALTDFCTRAWNSRWKRWNVCKRASGFHKRSTIENGTAQSFLPFIEIIVMRNSLQTSRRGFYWVLFHIERWSRPSNTISQNANWMKKM